MSTKSGCAVSNARTAGTAGDTANGTPPLLFHGGPVMGTKLTGPVVVTPIFWHPAGHPMDAAYRRILTQYVADVANVSGQSNNVFSILTEYKGTNGKIRYQVSLGAPIQDTHALPADGCTLTTADMSNIYADNSGYNACLDDAQLQTEISNITSANGLPIDYAHMYVLFLPKHVESCFLAGQTTDPSNGQACTINYEKTAAYCAYHNFAQDNTIYSNMPYPIYNSGAHFTCGTNFHGGFPVIETPNGNADADVEVSPTSHEINESITDPDTVTGWYDSSGFENGDECAYIFGATAGTPGALYNQTIDHHHYLTQEEFSNKSFFLSGGGCLQGRP
ncbi:MAG TPA: hypothetical protein VLM11_07445 [Streptosporangiaceae bacterium]|nr:hypothetical protein [Streptosporangiaceae bacterium]